MRKALIIAGLVLVMLTSSSEVLAWLAADVLAAWGVGWLLVQAGKGGAL